MSEKHLTEKPWKDLVGRHGIKDLGLQKSFVAYANVDVTKEPVKAVDVLKEISELAIKVKKTSAAKADVVDYLDEVLKEVKKILPAFEAKAKAGAAAEAKAASDAKATAHAEEEEETEEAEAEKFKKDLKQQMVSALAQVKMRAPGEPEQEKEPKPQLQFMAYLTSKASSVIVAKKVGAATKKLLVEIAGGVSGGKYAMGECIFEKNAHTFVCDPVPSGLAKKLSVALQAETTAKYKVRARSADGSTVLDSDTDVDPDAAPAVSAAAKPPVSPPPAPEISKSATPKPPTAPPQPTGHTETTVKEIKLSTYLSGRKNLRAAREQAEKELKRLQQAILAKAADEPFYKEVEAKSQKLMDYLAPIDDAVANKLDDAGRCTDREEQASKNQEVRKLIQKQLTSLHSHPLAGFIDKNPFGKFIIKQPLEVTLTALDKQLS
jgi:hypothetical protein